MANTDLVLRMYDYYGKGDMASIRRELFHPDITWTMPGHHPLSATMEGADAVFAFFGALFEAGITVDDVHFGELDDGTVVETHMAHGKVGDEEFRLPTCTTYGVRDGRLFNVRVHPGDQHNVDRYFWTVCGLKGIPARWAAA